VSSGNILLVPPKGTWDQRGVIMDVEYGKPTDDTSAAHDVRTVRVAHFIPAFAEAHLRLM
jgi:hypothetical protein